MSVMQSRKRSLAILLCLFLISFKVAAGSIFIDAALERAHLLQSSFSVVVFDQANHPKEASGGEQQSHTLFLMSHVTANITDIGIAVLLPSYTEYEYFSINETLFTQNFPDSAFKPPKVNI